MKKNFQWSHITMNNRLKYVLKIRVLHFGIRASGHDPMEFLNRE